MTDPRESGTKRPDFSANGARSALISPVTAPKNAENVRNRKRRNGFRNFSEMEARYEF